VDIRQELRSLAAFASHEMPVVSVYLDTQWRDLHQYERTAMFLKNRLHQATTLAFDAEAAQQSLHDDLQRILNWSTERLQRSRLPHTPGVALFACSGSDLWVELPSPVPFENELTIADSPALRQLARLDHDYATTLVVLVDSRAARICEVVMGGWSAETDITSEVPGRHQQGGWAQMRYQRHVKDHMDRHHKEVAEYLAAYHQAQPQALIILSGQDEIIANLRQFLPTQVQQQVLDVVRLDIHESQADILQTARDIIEQHEREEEQDLVHRLLHRAGHGGLAAVGMQETLDAANAGRIHLLIMHRDLTYPGWHCPGCRHLGAEESPLCPVCGHTTAAVELGEALVSRALQTDASVELIEPEPHLTAFDGIGVFLRYY